MTPIPAKKHCLHDYSHLRRIPTDSTKASNEFRDLGLSSHHGADEFWFSAGKKSKYRLC